MEIEINPCEIEGKKIEKGSISMIVQFTSAPNTYSEDEYDGQFVLGIIPSDSLCRYFNYSPNFNKHSNKDKDKEQANMIYKDFLPLLLTEASNDLHYLKKQEFHKLLRLLLYQSSEEEERNLKLSENNKKNLQLLLISLCPFQVLRKLCLDCAGVQSDKWEVNCIDYSNATLDNLLAQHSCLHNVLREENPLSNRVRKLLKRTFPLQMEELRKHVIPLVVSFAGTRAQDWRSFDDILAHNPLYHDSLLRMVEYSMGKNETIRIGSTSNVEVLTGDVVFALSKRNKFAIHYRYEITDSEECPFLARVIASTKSEEVIQALEHARRKIKGARTEFLIVSADLYIEESAQGSVENTTQFLSRMNLTGDWQPTLAVLLDLLGKAAGGNLANQLAADGDTEFAKKVFWFLDLIEMLLWASGVFNQKKQLQVSSEYW